MKSSSLVIWTADHEQTPQLPAYEAHTVCSFLHVKEKKTVKHFFCFKNEYFLSVDLSPAALGGGCVFSPLIINDKL